MTLRPDRPDRPVAVSPTMPRPRANSAALKGRSERSSAPSTARRTSILRNGTRSIGPIVPASCDSFRDRTSHLAPPAPESPLGRRVVRVTRHEEKKQVRALSGLLHRFTSFRHFESKTKCLKDMNRGQSVRPVTDPLSTPAQPPRSLERRAPHSRTRCCPSRRNSRSAR
jgi:hypothetical protein